MNSLHERTKTKQTKHSDGNPSIAQGRAALQEAQERQKGKPMQENRDARQIIRSSWRIILNQITRPAKMKVNGEQSYICPFCGHGKGGDGLTFDRSSHDGNRLKCFGCSWSGDIIDLYQKKTGKGYREALEELAAIVGMEADTPAQPGRAAAKNDFESRPNDLQAQAAKNATAGQNGATGAAAEVDYTDYYNQCAAQLEAPAAIAYLNRRGISLETAKAAHLGFDPDADPACNPGGKNRNKHTAARIIIPVTPDFYITRETAENPDKWNKMNSAGGTVGIFNAAALYSDAAEIFVTESTFNALSAMEAGAQAIAINGTSNAEKFVRTMAEHPTSATLIICPDDDQNNAGEKAAQKIRQGLQQLNLEYIDADINGGHNDANDFLRADRPAFMAAVKEAQKMAAEHRASGTPAQPGRNGPKNDFDGETRKVFDEPPKMAAEMAHTNTPKAAQEKLTRKAAARQSEIDALLQEASTDHYKPIPTGIPALDAALDGGMISQTLVFLGAEPGAGKTALATQIFENMARDGRPAIYYNLEMAREVLQARSLARIVYRGGAGPELTATKVLRAYNAPKTTRRAIEAAAADYKANIAPYLEYSAGSSNLDDLLQDMNAAAQTAEEAGQPAPHICIDYLQLITASRREDAQATIKRAVKEFKQYAIDHNAIVFVIIAQNRRANEEDKPTLQAGRDSSAIEYSGDLQLQLTGRTDKDGKRIPGEKTLHITKSRYTQAQKAIEFKFKGGQSYFEAAAEAETEMTFRNGESDTVI